MDVGATAVLEGVEHISQNKAQPLTTIFQTKQDFYEQLKLNQPRSRLLDNIFAVF